MSARASNVGGWVTSNATARGSPREEEARRNFRSEGPEASIQTLWQRPEVQDFETLRGENVGDVQRDMKDRKVRSDFDDVFNVDLDCGSSEFDYGVYGDDINVAGSLRQPSAIKFFEKLGAPKDVITTLRNGHISEFRSQVPSYERDNNQSFKNNEEFGIETLLELISKGKIEVVDRKPFIVNPLSVAIQRRKSRLILDCSYLN